MPEHQKIQIYPISYVLSIFYHLLSRLQDVHKYCFWDPSLHEAHLRNENTQWEVDYFTNSYLGEFWHIRFLQLAFVVKPDKEFQISRSSQFLLQEKSTLSNIKSFRETAQVHLEAKLVHKTVLNPTFAAFHWTQSNKAGTTAVIWKIRTCAAGF